MALRFHLGMVYDRVYAKDSGSAPQPVDPYTQAAAQYGLSTGTALYNAGLNRTSQTNPLGSSYWTTNTQPSGAAPSQYYIPNPNGPSPGETYTPKPNGGIGTALSPSTPASPGVTYQPFLGTSGTPAPTYSGGYVGPYGGYSGGTGAFGFGGSPPTYTLNTQLAPQFEGPLQQPIDTSGIAGMPGGPSTTQDLTDTRNALYDTQMSYIRPEQQLASEQLKSQLANEGITPGSEAYNNEMDRLSREQTFTNNQALNSAITGGGAEQSRLFGLGSQSLQNQITARQAPINEFNALSGSPGATATALTPDISGAFGQQYQGALAGYNANVSSDNATTGAVSSLALAAALYF